MSGKTKSSEPVIQLQTPFGGGKTHTLLCMYHLAKSPKEVKLSEVIQLLEGSIALVECVNNPEVCNRSELCVTRDIWGELKKAMDGVLESTTLRDLVERQKNKGQSEPVMYHI